MISWYEIKSKVKDGLRNKTIRNILIVGFLGLMVSGLGFVKEMVVADRLGLSLLLDTFLIAVLIPTFISNVFSGAFQSVFIPNYVSELNQGRDTASFQGACFMITLLVSVLFIIMAVLFTDYYLEINYAGHDEHYYSLVKKQFYFVVPCIFLWGVSALITGLLNINDEFTFTTLSSAFTPVMMMIFLIFFRDSLGDIVLSLGMLVGSFLTFLSLLIVALKQKVINISFPNFYSPNIKMLFKQLPAKLTSGVLTGANDVIDQHFAAQLVIGSIAALNYGIKIPMFFIGILVMALGNVLLPYFSKKALENRAETFKDLKRILRYILLGATGITIIMILISHPVISLLFERNAFTSTDSVIVSDIQQMYLLQVPTYIISMIMVRFLTAINKNNFMVLAAVLTVFLNYTFNYLLIKKLGVQGLALATSIVSLINCLVLYSYVHYLSKIK